MGKPDAAALGAEIPAGHSTRVVHQVHGLLQQVSQPKALREDRDLSKNSSSEFWAASSLSLLQYHVSSDMHLVDPLTDTDILLAAKPTLHMALPDALCCCGCMMTASGWWLWPDS